MDIQLTGGIVSNHASSVSDASIDKASKVDELIDSYKPIKPSNVNQNLRKKKAIGLHSVTFNNGIGGKGKGKHDSWDSYEEDLLRKNENNFWSRFEKMNISETSSSPFGLSLDTQMKTDDDDDNDEDGERDNEEKMDLTFSNDNENEQTMLSSSTGIGADGSNKYRDSINLKAPVTCVHYAPKNWRDLASSSDDGSSSNGPMKLAVTSGSKVLIYDAKTMSLMKSVSRFKEIAHSGQIRFDGSLLCAGCDDGEVKVFNIDGAGSSLLRTYSGEHRGPVKVVKWAPMEAGKIATGSDDKTAKLWDVSSDKSLVTFKGHNDYVRSLAHAVGDRWITGSYDHKVRVFDERTQDQNNVIEFDHGSPVECVLPLPGGSVVLSSGGDTIKAWDLVSGSDKPIHEFSNHQKTITSLCMDAEGKRIMSASLDSLVKVYNMGTFEVLHTFRTPGPILSLSMANDNSRFAVGTANGLISVRERRAPPPRLLPLPLPRGGSRRFFVRGRDEIPSADDIHIKANKKQKLKSYDKLLKAFKYHEALDAVLETRNPTLVVAMLEELINRDGLYVALSGRDEMNLEPILSFLVKYTTNPAYSSFLSTVCEKVLTIHAGLLGRSTVVDSLMMKLSKQIKQELRLHKELMKLSGVVDMLLSSSSSSSSSN